MALPIIIDTDGGVDDAAALWWALTDPSLQVLAISVVWGNVPLATAAASVNRVLAAAGRLDVPVALGASGALGAAPDLRPATFIHGDDGLGNSTFAAPAPPPHPTPAPAASELLAGLCRERPGEITLVTLGPLSTIGALVAADPGFAATVGELVVMGGSARFGGNALANGEANVAHDPLAAAAVAAAAWLRPPLLVGLDVTMRATLTDDHFALLSEHRTPAARFLDAPLRFYRRFGATETAPDCPCHDFVAVLAAGDPAIITDAPVLPMAVDTAGGVAWGSTIVDFRSPPDEALEGVELERQRAFSPWRIALAADVELFRRQGRALFGG